MGSLGPFGKRGGWAAVVGWLSAGTAGKAQTWELLSQMKRTQQGFKALFLGFLCIGKFLRVSRSNNSSRPCPQRKSIVGAHGRHAQSSSAMKSAGIKGKKNQLFPLWSVWIDPKIKEVVAGGGWVLMDVSGVSLGELVAWSLMLRPAGILGTASLLQLHSCEARLQQWENTLNTFKVLRSYLAAWQNT